MWALGGAGLTGGRGPCDAAGSQEELAFNELTVCLLGAPCLERQMEIGSYFLGEAIVS